MTRCKLFPILLILGVGTLIVSGPAFATDPTPTLRFDLTQAGLYPFHSVATPVFFSPGENQLVLIPGLFSLGSGAPALISNNQGRSWQNFDGFSTWPAMGYTDVVHRGDEWLAFGSLSDPYVGTNLWRSSDEGLTWTGGNRLTQDTDRYAPMNQRVATVGNRLIIPVEQLAGVEGTGANSVGTIYSDDGGQSWNKNPFFGPPPGIPAAPEGIREPSVVGLANGKTWMISAGLGGKLFESWSDDNGASWGPPIATSLVSPLSAVQARRIPGSDAVIVIWNNSPPGESTDWNDIQNNVWNPRSPLVFAISKDNCRSWSQPVTVETGTAAYPSIYFSGTEMFLAYWKDNDPTAKYLNSNSHMTMIVYDIQSLLNIPAPTTIPDPKVIVTGTYTTVVTAPALPANNLILQNSDTLSGSFAGGSTPAFGAPFPGVMNNGVMTDADAPAETILGWDDVTEDFGWAVYQLDTSTNTLGYDVTNILSYAGWTGARVNQAVEIKYSLVGETITEGEELGHTLGTFSYAPSNNGTPYAYTTMSITNNAGSAMLSGISAIQVKYIDNMFDGNTGTVGAAGNFTAYKQFAVIGTATTAPIPGDANRDGVVNEADAAVLAANWQTASVATWEMGDFDGDGDVDDIDVTLLASNWHIGISDVSVPEPGGIILLAGVFVALLLR